MSTDDEGSLSAPALRATCWGTRGSIATPGPATLRFGGNTSCLEVRTADGGCYVFDAGTVIRGLGGRLLEEGRHEVDIFLSHYHWDHIQGFPFLPHNYNPACRVRIRGPAQEGVTVKDALAAQTRPPYFPVTLDAFRGTLEFEEVEEGSWSDGAVEVTAFRVNHTGHTFGYRVRAGGASLAYVPDNDLGGDDAWYRALVDFLRGADLLFHDAMFTDEEYARFTGFGHSSFRQAIRLAEDAGVRRLALFHHAPDRGDAELERIVAELRRELAERGSPLELSVATEGEEIALAGTGG